MSATEQPPLRVRTRDRKERSERNSKGPYVRRVSRLAVVCCSATDLTNRRVFVRRMVRRSVVTTGEERTEQDGTTTQRDRRFFPFAVCPTVSLSPLVVHGIGAGGIQGARRSNTKFHAAVREQLGQLDIGDNIRLFSIDGPRKTEHHGERYDRRCRRQ